MDSLTHVLFAHKLLKLCDAESSATVCSLFPQIDRRPAFFHRMYSHPFAQMSRLVEAGTYVLEHGEMREGCKGVYEWQRFLEDRGRMKEYEERFENEFGVSIPRTTPDKGSALIACVSHSFLDIFNNPVQAFLPFSVYPCATWALWTEVDPLHFRATLYKEETISALRHDLARDSIWNTRLHGPALIRALVNRTGIASVVNLPKVVVDEVCASFDIELDFTEAEMQLADAFMIEFEHVLSKLIRQYSLAHT